MASNVFPMLSSSPPPIDDCPDDDDDEDEFGNFNSANIPFDSSFDSPVAVDKFKSFKSGDNGVNNANFSDEIHKFNFSNSATPSPQEFVPNFSNESEHSKNGFKPIKSELCESDKSSVENLIHDNETETTSHKPPVPSEHLAHSLRDSEPFSSKDCGNHKKIIIKSSNKKDLGKGILKDPSSESDSFDEETLPVCNSLKDTDNSSHENHENKFDNICDQPIKCTSDSYNNFEFSKCNKVLGENSIDGESCLPSDKFECNFNFENSENDIEDFADFQQSEKLFPPNVHSSTLELDCKFPTAFDEDNSETKFKPSFENKPINDFSDNEFDDFQTCSENVVSAQVAENSETFFKSKVNEEVDEFSDSEFDGFQSCNKTLASAQTVEKSDAMLKCTIKDEEKSEFSDNEFDDFQGCGEDVALAQDAGTSTKSNGDEYDDFQEFQFTDALKEDAEDFADFQDSNAINASNTDDFADFSSASFENKVSHPSEPSDFADFKEASFSTPAETSSPATSSTVQKSVDTLSTVLNAIFPLPDTPQDCDTTSDKPSSQILEQSNKSRRLWEKLHEVEQAPGLRFQWGISHSFQQLLRSVNIDYHSILRTSSVPIFASGLSLLEPVKGLSNSANHESEDRNHNPKDPIPPVEFDWTSSGLVNPLDSVQCGSTLMDLSFLSSVGTSTNVTTKDNSFESELLKPSPVLACPDSNSQTHILEQLLSKNVSSLPNSKLSRRPSNLSDEAIRVLDQLPDLSFMQAKVLMFPISNKT